MSQWCARRGNAATPWTNMNNSCWNKTKSCQDDAFWYITRSYERLCWELEQNKNEFLFWPQRTHIFRIARRYLLHSLIFPHSLHIFKDFGMQITNPAIFAKIFIFQRASTFSYVDLKDFLMSQIHQLESSICDECNQGEKNTGRWTQQLDGE